MTLRLIREPSRNGATLGVLFVDHVFQCWILEDEIRDKPGRPVHAWKVPGQTAIPAGRYRITITDSARFKRPLPLLVDVPGFSGIRIHPGNRIQDTEGCLLPGLTRGEARVDGSRLAFNVLFERLQKALLIGEAWIAIENPPIVAEAPAA